MPSSRKVNLIASLAWSSFRLASRLRSAILHPRVLGEVEIPIAAIGDTNGFSLLFVGDFFEINVGRKDVHENVAGDNGNQARACFRAFHEGEFYWIYGINVTGYARDAALVGVDGADKMPVMVLIIMAAM